MHSYLTSQAHPDDNDMYYNLWDELWTGTNVYHPIYWARHSSLKNLRTYKQLLASSSCGDFISQLWSMCRPLSGQVAGPSTLRLCALRSWSGPCTGSLNRCKHQNSLFKECGTCIWPSHWPIVCYRCMSNLRDQTIWSGWITSNTI